MIRLQIESESKENVVDIIKHAISAEVKRLEIGLERTNRQIREFEEKYRASSEDFLRDFTAEEMEHGDAEYVEWAGELKIRDRILRDLRQLKEIEYVAQ